MLDGAILYIVLIIEHNRDVSPANNALFIFWVELMKTFSIELLFNINLLSVSRYVTTELAGRLPVGGKRPFSFPAASTPSLGSTQPPKCGPSLNPVVTICATRFYILTNSTFFPQNVLCIVLRTKNDYFSVQH